MAISIYPKFFQLTNGKQKNDNALCTDSQYARLSRNDRFQRSVHEAMYRYGVAIRVINLLLLIGAVALCCAGAFVPIFGTPFIALGAMNVLQSIGMGVGASLAGYFGSRFLVMPVIFGFFDFLVRSHKLSHEINKNNRVGVPTLKLELDGRTSSLIDTVLNSDHESESLLSLGRSSGDFRPLQNSGNSQGGSATVSGKASAKSTRRQSNPRF